MVNKTSFELVCALLANDIKKNNPKKNCLKLILLKILIKLYVYYLNKFTLIKQLNSQQN